MFLKSTGAKCFAKIMGGNCCPSQISFKPFSQLPSIAAFSSNCVENILKQN